MNVFKKFVNLFTKKPTFTESGDVKGKDNDGDGAKEDEYVKGYIKKNGTKVRDFYRKK